jgi:hypothetical protein
MDEDEIFYNAKAYLGGIDTVKFLWRFLGKQEEKEVPEISEDIMRVPRLIEPLLNKAALDIVEAYKSKLLNESVTYIVPAIWGAKEKGKMDIVQEEIYQKVTPMIHEIFDKLNVDCHTAAQRFTIGYMIKGLIISKITYMLEVLKNRLKDDFTVQDRDGDNPLVHIEPIGNA